MSYPPSEDVPRKSFLLVDSGHRSKTESEMSGTAANQLLRRQQAGTVVKAFPTTSPSYRESIETGLRITNPDLPMSLNVPCPRLPGGKGGKAVREVRPIDEDEGRRIDRLAPG